MKLPNIKTKIEGNTIIQSIYTTTGKLILAHWMQYDWLIKQNKKKYYIKQNSYNLFVVTEELKNGVVNTISMRLRPLEMMFGKYRIRRLLSKKMAEDI